LKRAKIFEPFISCEISFAGFSICLDTHYKYKWKGIVYNDRWYDEAILQVNWGQTGSNIHHSLVLAIFYAMYQHIMSSLYLLQIKQSNLTMTN